MLKLTSLATKPPMGWNSWDVFGPSITEAETIEHAQIMSDRLLSSGYEYLVIDGAWSFPLGQPGEYCISGPPAIDEYGRYRPDPGRFPSSQGNGDFAQLAAKIHALGLKFGIHVMRGIPRCAADAKLPVLGTNLTCNDLADRSSTCSWSDLMYGVRTDLPEAQTWYDVHFALWASWGVDFIKMDDLSSPYHAAEAEIIAKAALRCGRPMVLSFSPGDNTPFDQADHLRSHTHMWRITKDFWDTWDDVRGAMDALAQWSPYTQPSAWPDADMLPLGRISVRGNERGLSDRQTRLTPAEQRTMFTLWSVARSPLFLGTHLPSLSDDVLELITHPELVMLNQNGTNPREILRTDDLIIWRTHLGLTTYLLIINVGNESLSTTFDLETVGVNAAIGNEVFSLSEHPLVHQALPLHIDSHDCALLSFRD